MADQRYAVVIGVDEPGVDDTHPTLRYAQEDARSVRNALCDPISGSFDPADVTLFVGARAAAANIKATLRRIAIASDKSDLLVVYFAGHTLVPGWSAGTDVYLSTPDLDEDALPDDPDAGLRLAFLTRDVFPIFAGTAVLVLDTCQSGHSGMPGFLEQHDPDFAVLAACAADGAAHGHGELTHHLLEALRGRATDERGLVTFDSMTTYVRQRLADPQSSVPRGPIVLTVPGGGAVPTMPPAAAVETASLVSPLDRYVPEVRRLIRRLSSSSAVAGVTSRVEYLRSAVDARAVAYLSYTAGEFVAIDATAPFDLNTVRHLLHTEDGDVHFPLNPRWFGHVAGDGSQQVWCVPLDRAEDRVLLLAVIDPPAWLVQLGQPGAKVLQTIWGADFAGSPAEAEITALTALRNVFGRVPEELFERCLQLYREVLASFRIVFQPVVTLGERPAQVGVHSYEALARRSLQDQSAPFAMLEVAHIWGDHFVVERDKIILGKALSAYALAHAAGPWDVQKPVSVNVSVRSLLNDSYIKTLKEAISAFHLDPASVTLEISEKDAIEPWAGERWNEAPHTHFHKRLAAISRDVGVAFAVDDFGVGYATVSRMAELRLTQIKVDRAILHHRQALQELDLVVAVARDAGEPHTARAVIVEGVDAESPVTLRQIYRRGIKHVQGYITGERGGPELRRLNTEVRKDIAARVRGDDAPRPNSLSHPDEEPLARGA